MGEGRLSRSPENPSPTCCIELPPTPLHALSDPKWRCLTIPSPRTSARSRPQPPKPPPFTCFSTGRRTQREHVWPWPWSWRWEGWQRRARWWRWLHDDPHDRRTGSGVRNLHLTDRNLVSRHMGAGFERGHLLFWQLPDSLGPLLILSRQERDRPRCVLEPPAWFEPPPFLFSALPLGPHSHRALPSFSGRDIRRVATQQSQRGKRDAMFTVRVAPSPCPSNPVFNPCAKAHISDAERRYPRL